MNTSIHIIVLLNHYHTKAIFCCKILLLEASECIPYLCFLNVYTDKYIKVYFTEMYWHTGKKAGTPTAHKQVKKQLSVCYKYAIDWREWYQSTLEYWFQIQALLHSLLLLHRKSLLLFLVILFPIYCKLSSLVCCYYVFFLPLFLFVQCSNFYSVCNSFGAQ